MAIPPLLAAGVHSQAILRQARHLGAAIAQQPYGAIHAADQLRRTLQVWFDGWLQPQRRERFTSRRRRSTVNEARQWMAERLQERFSVVECSQAVAVSPRQLMPRSPSRRRHNGDERKTHGREGQCRERGVRPCQYGGDPSIIMAALAL